MKLQIDVKKELEDLTASNKLYGHLHFLANGRKFFTINKSWRKLDYVLIIHYDYELKIVNFPVIDFGRVELI